MCVRVFYNRYVALFSLACACVHEHVYEHGHSTAMHSKRIKYDAFDGILTLTAVTARGANTRLAEQRPRPASWRSVQLTARAPRTVTVYNYVQL